MHFRVLLIACRWTRWLGRCFPAWGVQFQQMRNIRKGILSHILTFSSVLDWRFLNQTLWVHMFRVWIVVFDSGHPLSWLHIQQLWNLLRTWLWVACLLVLVSGTIGKNIRRVCSSLWNLPSNLLVHKVWKFFWGVWKTGWTVLKGVECSFGYSLKFRYTSVTLFLIWETELLRESLSLCRLGGNSIWCDCTSQEVDLFNSEMTLWHGEFPSRIAYTFEDSSDICTQLFCVVGCYADVIDMLGSLICFNCFIQALSHEAWECLKWSAETLSKPTASKWCLQN